MSQIKRVIGMALLLGWGWAAGMVAYALDGYPSSTNPVWPMLQLQLETRLDYLNAAIHLCDKRAYEQLVDDVEAAVEAMGGQLRQSHHQWSGLSVDDLYDAVQQIDPEQRSPEMTLYLQGVQQARQQIYYESLNMLHCSSFQTHQIIAVVDNVAAGVAGLREQWRQEIAEMDEDLAQCRSEAFQSNMEALRTVHQQPAFQQLAWSAAWYGYALGLDKAYYRLKEATSYLDRSLSDLERRWQESSCREALAVFAQLQTDLRWTATPGRMFPVPSVKKNVFASDKGCETPSLLEVIRNTSSGARCQIKVTSFIQVKGALPESDTPCQRQLAGLRQVLDEYFSTQWTPPDSETIEGQVMLRYYFFPDGRFEKVRLLHGSGHPVWDQHVLNGIGRLEKHFPILSACTSTTNSAIHHQIRFIPLSGTP